MRNSQHAHTQCIPVQTNEMRDGERERKRVEDRFIFSCEKEEKKGMIKEVQK